MIPIAKQCFFAIYFAPSSLSIEKQISPAKLYSSDLTDLLIRGRQMAFLDFKHLRLQDLALKSNVDDLFQRFLSIPLFDKFNSISIATIHQSFDTNQERYANRSRLKFDFDLSMQRIYHQALESWHQQISYSPIAIHNTVRELDGHY